VLPNMNFTNTQFKTADTQYILILKGKYTISPIKTCFSDNCSIPNATIGSLFVFVIIVLSFDKGSCDQNSFSPYLKQCV